MGVPLGSGVGRLEGNIEGNALGEGDLVGKALGSNVGNCDGAGDSEGALLGAQDFFLHDLFRSAVNMTSIFLDDPRIDRFGPGKIGRFRQAAKGVEERKCSMAKPAQYVDDLQTLIVARTQLGFFRFGYF